MPAIEIATLALLVAGTLLAIWKFSGERWRRHDRQTEEEAVNAERNARTALLVEQLAAAVLPRADNLGQSLVEQVVGLATAADGRDRRLEQIEAGVEQLRERDEQMSEAIATVVEVISAHTQAEDARSERSLTMLEELTKRRKK